MLLSVKGGARATVQQKIFRKTDCELPPKAFAKLV